MELCYEYITTSHRIWFYLIIKLIFSWHRSFSFRMSLLLINYIFPLSIIWGSTGALLIVSSCCILFFCSGLMAPAGELIPATVYLNVSKYPHDSSGWKQKFTFSFADFLAIQFKFALQFNENYCKHVWLWTTFFHRNSVVLEIWVNTTYSALSWGEKMLHFIGVKWSFKHLHSMKLYTACCIQGPLEIT